jgi:putative transposase
VLPRRTSGAYCRARAKLSESVLRRLTYEVADALETQVPKAWLWYGRHVKIVDGSTLMTPETKENRAEWPQMSRQLPGLGFPILRFVMLFSLATAAVCGFADAPYEGKETGEPALLRELFHRLRNGDILLGDACFCSYFMIALLIALGVDVVFHQHQRRKTDYRRGKSLGDQDHLVTWSKPSRPDWMDEATYNQFPDEIVIRELTVKVKIPGFRTLKVTLVTTLTNAKSYSKQALGDLYRQRWNAETDIRSLKVTMNLEDLRGKCPHMIRNEIWAHCLAYNLICQSRAAAAVVSEEQTPRTISFAGALQSVAGAMVQASTASLSILRALADQKLASIARHRVGNRPNRVEPRAVKRRPKNQKLLSKPRDEARAELGAKTTPDLACSICRVFARFSNFSHAYFSVTEGKILPACRARVLRLPGQEPQLRWPPQILPACRARVLRLPGQERGRLGAPIMASEPNALAGKRRGFGSRKLKIRGARPVRGQQA